VLRQSKHLVAFFYRLVSHANGVLTAPFKFYHHFIDVNIRSQYYPALKIGLDLIGQGLHLFEPPLLWDLLNYRRRVNKALNLFPTSHWHRSHDGMLRLVRSLYIQFISRDLQTPASQAYLRPIPFIAPPAAPTRPCTRPGRATLASPRHWCLSRPTGSMGLCVGICGPRDQLQLPIGPHQLKKNHRAPLLPKARWRVLHAAPMAETSGMAVGWAHP
jgi:hypothetical protein